MKLNVDRKELLTACQLCAPLAVKSSVRPILRTIKLVAGDHCQARATDLEIGLSLDVADCEVQEPGTCCLPYERIVSILKALPADRVTLKAAGQKITIKGERSEFKLPSENAADFPAFPDSAAADCHTVDGDSLVAALARTVFATDETSQRYALGGVCLEFRDGQVIAVATDGHRLAKAELPATKIGTGCPDKRKTFVVPTKACKLIGRIVAGEATSLSIANNALIAATSKGSIWARLIEGRFPSWEDVLPKSHVFTFHLTAGDLVAPFRQAAIITSEEARGVNVNFNTGFVKLEAEAPDVGAAAIEIPLTYNGPPAAIKLDPRFVLDFLTCLDPDSRCTVSLKDGSSAALFTTDDGYAYVVMPLAKDR